MKKKIIVILITILLISITVASTNVAAINDHNKNNKLFDETINDNPFVYTPPSPSFNFGKTRTLFQPSLTHKIRTPTQHFVCSIKVTGKIQLNIQPFQLPIGENSLIIYWQMQFISGSAVHVLLDGEELIFDSGGNMNIVGFFGIYISEPDNMDDRINVHLDGKAFFVKIIAEHHNEPDDSYLPIVHSLDTITYSLDKSPLELSDEDLDSLSYLSDCKIVGLGEATHGTKEFFQLKHRIFRYLVENHDFKVFAFEADMGESYYVNNYVINGEGDIDYIMINIMHFWTWRTEEVKKLLVWMKEYNEDKSDEDKIHFIGVDCQFLTYQADIIMDFFNRSEVTLSDDCLNFLQEIDQIGSNTYEFYGSISLDKKNEINQSTDKLLTTIEEFRDELTLVLSEFEYQFLKQITLNIKQVNDACYSYYHGGRNYRDLYMAENTFWTSDLFGGQIKVALWAHNFHVSNISWYESIGMHLKKELNDGYQTIYFGFSFGSFTAKYIENNGYYTLRTNYITRMPKYGSINYVFHYVQDDNFILREADIQPDSEFDTWISRSRKSLDIGALFDGNSYHYYYSHKFKEISDVLIYWDDTTASEQLSTYTSPNHNCNFYQNPSFSFI